ncbi:MAG TPA: VWA domain-containing protein [Blastocatellia bacterium]|nr:VWA domain-containing protein [Blastocatellia bacterium]
MRTPALFVCLITAMLFSGFIRSSNSQTGAESTGLRPAGQKTDQLRLNVDLVVLDAQALQKKTARIVGGLTKNDFLLFEDGVRQQIAQFGRDTLPLSVVLLVDRGGCLDPFGDKVREATIEALRRLKPDDEVALMAFADDVQLLRGFRLDKQAVADALNRMPPHDEDARHCFNRAFYEAAALMRKAANPDGRRVIIVITGITHDIACSNPSAEETRNQVLESGAVVCGLIPSTSGQRIENGVMSSVAAVAGIFKAPTSSLSQFADETGGEIFSARPAELDRAFGTLVDHLRSRYTIGFVSTNAKRDGSYRKLKLEVTSDIQRREGQVVVKTRRGYLAPNTTDKGVRPNLTGFEKPN